MKQSVLFLFLFLAMACTRPEHTLPEVSFYYWKTTFRLTAPEREALRQHRVSKLYVRYFDIAIQHDTPVPVSPIVFHDAPDTLKIVPVVYIKNEVMLHAALKPAELAQKVITYIDQVNAEHSMLIQELQIDCDWTLTSRNTYFRFLEQLKRLSGKKISVTIRLHQVKYYATTGIPPADRGVLMYYNMGRISPDVASSIYDRATAHAYLESVSTYPRPLDVALPIFSWGIHLRDNKVIGLLNKADNATFIQDAHFEMKTQPFFEVRQNVIKIGRYFKQGDRVKVESVSADNLLEMATDLEDELLQPPGEIIFYDLDAFNLNHYENEKDILEDVRHRF
jgi:hypothetical protein